MTIQEKVQNYLRTSENRYQSGQIEYFARLALAEALQAFNGDNYGIGAVAIKVTKDKIYEFREGNAMVTGLGVVDHAETRALLKLKSGAAPDREYSRDTNQWTASLLLGISVFGTLEPCPMCTCTLTNVGAMLSVSTVRDGDLVTSPEGYKISNGAANVVVYKDAQTGEFKNKYQIQPQVWQTIQTNHKLEFKILQSSDEELKELSMLIFVETREQIDRQLAERGLSTYNANRAAALFI